MFQLAACKHAKTRERQLDFKAFEQAVDVIIAILQTRLVLLSSKPRPYSLTLSLGTDSAWLVVGSPAVPPGRNKLTHHDKLLPLTSASPPSTEVPRNKMITPHLIARLGAKRGEGLAVNRACLDAKMPARTCRRTGSNEESDVTSDGRRITEDCRGSSFRHYSMPDMQVIRRSTCSRMLMARLDNLYDPTLLPVKFDNKQDGLGAQSRNGSLEKLKNLFCPCGTFCGC